MNKYAKILMTHDGSLMASASISHVAELSKVFGSEVIVLQVVDSVVTIMNSITSTTALFGTQTIYKDVAKREKILARTNLKEVKKQLSESGVENVSTMILEGDARDVIIDTAKDNKCDLIVMSTHGRSGIRRALLGSVAEDVVRHSPCPVLLVHVKK